MRFLLLSAALAAQVLAQGKRGFNYGANGPSGPRAQQDFEAEFNRAKTLPGTAPFTSARLFTMIQANTANDPSSAIPAAIATNTSLLLGLWASAGQDAFNQELEALRRALEQFGQPFIDLIDGISVGSEDLYRITPTGIANKAGIGASPDDLVKYIQQTRDKLNGHDNLKSKIGHVDTWTAWVNETNYPVTTACDWIGMDSYPYYQKEVPNSIDQAKELFFQSYNTTKNVSQGKKVLVTETGWPVAGPDFGLAKANVDNAKRFWDEVGCALFAEPVDTWWFTLDDSKQNPEEISFSVVKPGLGDPIWDLKCPGQ
ncbi:putative glucan endo-1,3-beta-glucosidase eglC [Cercospora beticola]|uniref:Probable glucan endo-1,3-beta-glucosidase eglC n=1 Tax=Cercospora beticola TaxID=122368 RepID=A0A2G5HG26_CERBT|nr:putative glucan endo-1,3-beta-glucosidase eglC [Cercospora beticola]PIA91488.1 putative glucan endo-1,3-beta-glucosidase eglC [Cercospora beticola]WPB05705.1 hypothetical protein RHO25_010359 [Cercospora beticola]CAK1365554.1 unnamed protein product [Cercospora beticola]